MPGQCLALHIGILVPWRTHARKSLPLIKPQDNKKSTYMSLGLSFLICEMELVTSGFCKVLTSYDKQGVQSMQYS